MPLITNISSFFTCIKYWRKTVIGVVYYAEIKKKKKVEVAVIISSSVIFPIRSSTEVSNVASPLLVQRMFRGILVRNIWCIFEQCVTDNRRSNLLKFVSVHRTDIKHQTNSLCITSINIHPF